MSAEALAGLDELLGSGGEPDDLLRAVVELLVERTRAEWAGIAFVEQGLLALGPVAGVPDEARRVRVPIEYQQAPVGELWVDGDVERTALEEVAARVAQHVLIGWDTSGERWEP